jgi:hypothetical protein
VKCFENSSVGNTIFVERLRLIIFDVRLICVERFMDNPRRPGADVVKLFTVVSYDFS